MMTLWVIIGASVIAFAAYLSLRGQPDTEATPQAESGPEPEVEKKKEPKVGTYRIRPCAPDDYVVERWKLSESYPYNTYEWVVEKGYQYGKEVVDNSGKMVWLPGYNYNLRFKTEKEAEEYIRKELDRQTTARRKELEKQMWLEANPPREVPPYKYETKDSV